MTQNLTYQCIKNFEEHLNQLLYDIDIWRINNNLTQQELADQLNITRSHLNKILNKKRLPSLQLIDKLEEICYGKQI